MPTTGGTTDILQAALQEMWTIALQCSKSLGVLVQIRIQVWQLKCKMQGPYIFCFQKKKKKSERWNLSHSGSNKPKRLLKTTAVLNATYTRYFPSIFSTIWLHPQVISLLSQDSYQGG